VYSNKIFIMTLGTSDSDLNLCYAGSVYTVWFEVLMAVRMMVVMFWVLTLCRIVGRYQCFGET
jgi:hypothetical protein